MKNGDHDYIEKNGGALEVWRHAGGVRVQLPYGNFVFLGLNSEELQEQVNEAMKTALPYYANNVGKTNVAVDHKYVEEASLVASMHVISVHNEWNRRPWFLKWSKPILSVSEFGQIPVRDRILFFCQRRFGEHYAQPPAALMGMRPEEFAAWEAERRKFWELW
jgi:hypothetical protein